MRTATKTRFVLAREPISPLHQSTRIPQVRSRLLYEFSSTALLDDALGTVTTLNFATEPVLLLYIVE
ncbi:hypothetical protein F7734_23700 [Scytonema sp. UIC 10036]|uniref:hypothetical protein n=1 Tax=Scytonema sp. UIC 10036 TaxID=2304196 RepID=UPI0012DAE919|nr:hypothetical protein [Scytonema sp. UIC 10036]MUG95199.1 hypothetical protein [Scytonema sp. UIC 10036]